MLKLSMTSLRHHQLPPIRFKQTNHVTNLHQVNISNRYSDWPDEQLFPNLLTEHIRCKRSTGADQSPDAANKRSAAPSRTPDVPGQPCIRFISSPWRPILKNWAYPLFYLVRVPVKSGVEWEWSGQWLEPPPAARTQPHVEPPDELRLRRIRKTVPRNQGVWQADTFITPISIEEGERPSPPRTLLCADRESYFVLGVSVSAQSEWRADLPKRFLEWIESHGILPGEFQVRRKDVYETLKPLTTPLNIKIRLVKNLRAVNAAKASLLGFLSRRRI